MDASIDFSGVLKGSIADGGGGGGGDTVIITPVVTSGTKIADVSVNGVEKDLYCLTPPEISITPLQQSGTKIGSIEVNGNEVDLYAPNPIQVSVAQVQQSGTKIATIGVNGVSTDLYAPNSDGHEYTTTEHVVGKWIDGSDIYEITIPCNVRTTTQIIPITNIHDFSNFKCFISAIGYYTKLNEEGVFWLDIYKYQDVINLQCSVDTFLDRITFQYTKIS